MHSERLASLARTTFALIATALALATVTVPCAWAAGEAASGGLPPLIDRDLFFGDPQIAGAQISPDGASISFLKPNQGVLNIWVKEVDQPFSAARPLTADTKRPVTSYFWSRDSRLVLYAQDKGGNENYHVWAVDPKGKPDEATGVPPARDLTPLDNVRAMIYAVPKATPKEILVGLNDRDPAAHDVYRINLATGERTLVVTNDQNVAAWVADLSGKVRLAWRQTGDGGSEILPVKDGRLGEPLYTCTFEETCQPLRFQPDGKHVYLESNKGMADLTRLMLMDAGTGATQLVESDPEDQVDLGGPIFSARTDALIGTYYVGDRVRIYPHDKAFAHDLEVLKAKLPDGELGFSSMTANDRRWVVSVSRDVNPGSVYLYDRADSTVTKLYDSRPELPSEDLAPMRPYRFAARDGLEIPAYLTVPKGLEAKKLPTVIFPHGGPWYRDTWGYNPVAQFLANRGYAVLQPNFRGSTGYGKAFLNAGNKQWGTGAMQHDLTDAVAALVKQGIADPERIAIMGGSYGGYATLAGLAFTPNLYACGVDIVGPSNIITLLDSIPPYWGPVKKMFLLRVGDPSDPAERAMLEKQSPLNSATKITAPLLVIQGANDPRVKKVEADQIVVALRDLHRKVEYLLAPDEGHGFAGRENRLAMFAVIEKFLGAQLGGRHQEGAAPDVAERIQDLRVDVASVKLPQKAAGAEEAATAPLPAPDPARIHPVALSYESKLSVGGQEMTVPATVTIAADTVEGQPAWRVTTTAGGPMAGATDTYLLDAVSLRPLRRAALQGPVKVDLTYSDDAVKGTIAMPSGDVSVDVSLQAPVLGDQAALEAVLPALPLVAGYTTTVRTFDMQSQKVRSWSVTVDGTEAVDVAAGHFDAFKVALEPLDDGGGAETLWIARDVPHATVKAEGILPAQMGGGAVHGELVSYQVGSASAEGGDVKNQE